MKIDKDERENTNDKLKQLGYLLVETIAREGMNLAKINLREAKARSGIPLGDWVIHVSRKNLVTVNVPAGWNPDDTIH